MSEPFIDPAKMVRIAKAVLPNAERDAQEARGQGDDHRARVRQTDADWYRQIIERYEPMIEREDA